MPAPPPQRRFAVLIDADNVSAKALEGLLAEVANYGTAMVKRIYGDWTTPSLNSWKKQLLEHAIQPIQQFRYTTGKNATDSALIIDAMDLLYEGKLDGFCLVSSDSDFTRLASRIREEGLMVIGFGERKTPRAFVTACDRFVHTDILRGARRPGGDEEEEDTRGRGETLPIDEELIDLLRWAVERSDDEPEGLLRPCRPGDIAILLPSRLSLAALRVQKADALLRAESRCLGSRCYHRRAHRRGRGRGHRGRHHNWRRRGDRLRR